MIKILTIIGARPQFIKAAAISRAIRNSFGNEITEIILHTGQHYDDRMSGIFFNELEIHVPHYNLGVGSASHGGQTAAMIRGIEEIIYKEKPSAVVVFGDTNSTLAGALAASKMHVPVAHIEAGLRSFNKKMPEEINRVLTDHVSTFLFVPTLQAVKNLENEGFSPANEGPFSTDHPAVCHCGDVMYDNSVYYAEKARKKCDIVERLGLAPKAFVLVTIHRDYNTDDPKRLQVIFTALASLADKEKMPFIIPVHPRTKNAIENTPAIKDLPQNTRSGLLFIQPASYLEMLRLEQNASMIITDSGGVQKEAYFCRNKCLVLRTETEWVELLDHGMLRLGGDTAEEIINEYFALKTLQVKDYPPIYGDGHAAEFICKVLAGNLDIAFP